MSAKGTGTHEGSAKRRGEQGRKRKERNRGRGTGRSRGGAGDDALLSGSAHARHALYDEITAKILSELEQGHIPWVRPWASHGGGEARTVAPAPPRNALSGRPYSGINILILWSAMIEHGYASHGWLTFKQALEAGGCVRKGERGTSIVYADRFIPKGEAERAAQEGGDIRVVPFLKRFTIFNLAQCEGLEVDLGADPIPLPRDKVAPVAEELILASGADFRIGGDKAHFVHDLDYIAVPHQSAFYDPINYYRTALHELTHWTGHVSRLGRDFSGAYGSAPYAREELCAEMGSAFLCASLGIVPTVRHADYIASWLGLLRADNRAIFRAASAASKAADYLLACRLPEPGSSACSAGGLTAAMRLRHAA